MQDTQNEIITANITGSDSNVHEPLGIFIMILNRKVKDSLNQQR